MKQIRRLTPGGPVWADDFNELAAAVEYLLRLDVEGGEYEHAPGAPLLRIRPATGRRLFRVHNADATTAPAYGLLMVTAVSADGVYTVEQPDTDDLTPIMLLVNEGSDIPAGGDGLANFDDSTTALYDHADGTPANGEDWGAGAGSWKLRKGKQGFKVWGNADTTAHTVIVARPHAGAPMADCVKVMTDWTCSGGTVTKTYTYLRGVHFSSDPCP